MELKQLIKELNDLELKQTSFEFEEIPEKYEKYFDDCVATEINIDKHRWYEASTTVFKFGENEFFGVVVVSDIYSEMSSLSDFYNILEFFEMKETKTVTYTKK